MENKIGITKTARYYTYGNINTAKHIWFCFHGYGQLAKFFIRNFHHLDPAENFVVAPEGFHRFYLDGVSGRVGATWMTKEDRLQDIDDYVAYIDLIYSRVIETHRSENQKLIAFGFSQGVATLSRWIAFGKASPDIAVLWGGSFPPDLEPASTQKKFSHIDTYCCIGDSDEYITAGRIDEVKAHFQAMGIDAIWITYRGTHRIPTGEFTRITNEYILS